MPPSLGLGLGLSRSAFFSGLDADAAAYIAAVETALSSSITADQKNAINTFFKTGKSAGWYSSIKRLYLPIWADAAANAIDMVSRTSGTFTATGVDHSNVGYVQGDKISGYFDFNISPSSAGLTSTSGMIGFLSKQSRTAGATGDTSIGCENSTSQRSRINSSGTLIVDLYSNLNRVSISSEVAGIITASRTSNTLLQLRKRSSTAITDSENTTSSVGTVPTRNLFAMANNSNGSATGFCDAQYGSFFMGLGLDANTTDAFTLALKNLWETASGLTLP